MLIKSVGKESLFDDQNPPGKACTRLVNGDPCEMLVVRAICRVLRVFRYTEVMYGAEDDLYCEICTRAFDKTGQRIRGTFFYTQASFKCPAANCEAQLTFRQFITGNCCRKAADEIESGKDQKFKFFLKFHFYPEKVLEKYRATYFDRKLAEIARFEKHFDRMKWGLKKSKEQMEKLCLVLEIPE